MPLIRVQDVQAGTPVTTINARQGIHNLDPGIAGGFALESD